MGNKSIEKDFEDLLFRTIPKDDTWAIPGMLKEFHERISRTVTYVYTTPDGSVHEFKFKINPLENGSKQC